MTDKNKISFVKRRFLDYKDNMRCRNLVQLKIYGVESDIENYKPSPIQIPTGTVTHDPHRSSELWDKIEKLEKKRREFDLLVDEVNNFLETLNDENNEILRLRYFYNDNLTIENIASKLNLGQGTVQRRIDELCLTFWYAYHDF